MFLKKLKNNNRGYSTLNWTVLITISIFVLCTMLDIVNLVVVKNTLIDRVSYLASVGTIQGGFVSSAPLGWSYVMGSAPYVSNAQARVYFESGLGVYPFVSGISISGLNQVPVHEDGVITGSCYYTPLFTKYFGTPRVYLSHSARFCGFWWYEHTQV